MDLISDAYDYATKMEEMGLDIEVIAPGLAETLITALGANTREINEYKQSLQDEIDEHDDSDMGCAVCITPSPHK